MTTTDRSPATIDLSDYADDPMTTALLELVRMVEGWPTERVDDVAQVLDDLTLVCATRQAPEARAAAEFLTGVRRMLRGLSVDFQPSGGV